jgi:transcriptional regulator with XRE-family HTH domain
MTLTSRVAAAYDREVEDVAFGYDVGKIRRLAGFSQAAFADLIPMERSRLARIECGRQRAIVGDVLAIEAALQKLGAIPGDGHLVWLTARAIPLLDEFLLATAAGRTAA